MLYKHMRPSRLVLLSATLCLSASAQTTQTLIATPTTVAWGYYSAHAKPVLTDQNPDYPHLSHDDAYALISTACDVDITQLVDTNDGVHVICPKALFTGPKSASNP
jgi:acetamidase/formamidase